MRASEDPYIQSHYGEFFVGLESIRLLAANAAAVFDAAWSQGDSLDAQGRGHVAVTVATAKVASTRVGLELTSRLFETTGARATHGALRLDRFWRNARVHTLHDPIDYKLRDLGRHALTGEFPTPTSYS